MALTSLQDIPTKPEAREPWTLRRLFPFSGAVTSLAKVFVNPFDILLGFLVLVLGINELMGRNVSRFFWVFITLVLLIALLEKHTNLFFDTKCQQNSNTKT